MMIKTIFVLATLFAVLPTVVSAAPAARQDFTKVRCEDNVDLIRNSLGSMTTGPDGHRFSEILGNNSKLKATTISATSNRLVCRITVNIFARGTSFDVRGRYTFTGFSDGRVEESFTPYS